MGLPKDCKINIRFGFEKGNNNLITDVPGVKVGHVTLNDEEKNIHTGVTAILPHMGNLFKNKVMAGASVINGFGKSVGLIQVDELGNIETPIIMTNTFGVGTALNALTKYMLKINDDIGVSTGTVNCIVTECNDGDLNDIRAMHISEKDVLQAIENCGNEFEEGTVGSGTGMICMGLKGGIGSASRIISYDGYNYTIGAVLMSNFGMPGNLIIDGNRFGSENVYDTPEKGSVIIIIATDLPLNERQLKRVAKRSVVSLARTGSFLGNCSGDIAIAFSNTNIIPHYSNESIVNIKMLHDNVLDKVFEAMAEAVEEAIISSLYHATTVKGISGESTFALKDFL